MDETMREPGADGVLWVKGSLSYASGDCVLVARLPGGQIGVRHSNDTAGPVLSFTRSEWAAFVAGVCGGEFDALLDG
jgi:hypothetical protein